MKINIPHFTRVLSCNTVQNFIAEAKRCAPLEVGAYAIACDGMPPLPGKHPEIAYFGEGDFPQRLYCYRYHIENWETCRRPHRPIHRMIAETLTHGRNVQIYVRPISKPISKIDAQCEERTLIKAYSPRCNKR